MPRRFDISVVIATRNRVALLKKSLVSIQRQRNDDLSIEIIVVDNGSSDETRHLLQQVWKGIEIVPLHEGIPGKSRALNRALESVRGRLLVFTDDDVIVSGNWISSIHKASGEYAQAKIFCGPVIPKFPAGTPVWLCNNSYLVAMFGAFQPKSAAGPLPMNLSPSGANFAIRAELVANQRFRLDLGPSEENGPMFHEDTEFISRFKQKLGDMVFVPAAYVVHQIEQERIEPSRLCERAFYYGRDRVLDARKPLFLHKHLRPPCVGPVPAETEQYERGVLINFYYGQQYQFWRDGIHNFDLDFLRALDDLKVDAHQHLITALAYEVHSSLPGTPRKSG